jgi:hypothetical protein
MPRQAISDPLPIIPRSNSPATKEDPSSSPLAVPHSNHYTSVQHISILCWLYLILTRSSGLSLSSKTLFVLGSLKMGILAEKFNKKGNVSDAKKSVSATSPLIFVTDKHTWVHFPSCLNTCSKPFNMIRNVHMIIPMIWNPSVAFDMGVL